MRSKAPWQRGKGQRSGDAAGGNGQVGHSSAASVKLIIGIVENHRVGVNTGWDAAGEHAVGCHGVRRRRYPLAWTQGDEMTIAVGANGELQPPVAARELISKIQRHREQAVAYGRGGVGEDRPERVAGGVGVKQGEL